MKTALNWNDALGGHVHDLVVGTNFGKFIIIWIVAICIARLND